MKQTLINALIRAVRTFAQTFIGVFLAGYAGGSLAELGNLTLLDTAAAAGIVAVLALIMNLLEGATGEPLPRG